jgi:putative transposase
MLKLQRSTEQATLLRETVQAANAAANQISATAWQTQTSSQFELHKLTYAEARVTSGLSAQVVVRLIAKVADACKPDQARQRRFRPLGGMAYDERILR